MQRRTLAPVVTALLCGTLGCSEAADDAAEEVEQRDEALSVQARSELIRAASWDRGIGNAVLVAGVAKQESQLAQCWSEATWACQGPWSDECGGPVLAGAGDGPCSAQQGGIGMFQFDAGTWWNTLAQYGNSILSTYGNAAAGADVIAGKVFSCPNTPAFGNMDEARAWIDLATPGTAEYEAFLTAMAWCYNGCAPSYKSCNHVAIREKYRSSIETMLAQLGWDFWYGADCTGGHAVYGAIRQKWLALGGCGSFVGAPLNSEEGTPDGVGRYNHFTGSGDYGASIYWTPATGAHEVHGAIRDHWAATGWELGPFGYPITDEYAYDGTEFGMPGWVAESELEHGWISFAFDTGEIFEWPK